MARPMGGFGYSRQVERARLLVVFGVVLLLLVGGVGVFLLGGGEEPTPIPDAAKLTVQKEEVQLRQVDVLVPRQVIKAGVVLEPHLFEAQKRSEIGVSPRVVRSASELTGMYARSDIPAGEPLIADYVTSVRPSNAITPNIPPGFRAVTISVNATSSVEGWALPGARVDVVWASQINGRPGVTVIVQNAKVLSAERMVDPNAQPGAPVPSTVTLLVTAEDAQRIQLATTSGSLSLSLRGDTDPGTGVSGSSITVEDLIGNKDGVRVKPKHEGLVEVRGADGQVHKMFLENGKLVPLTADNVESSR